ncbi:MAG TPA: choice-of-anchor L domain-containing protein, partial [Flavobacteriales bacterium]|nr:choice-of-anchor L domain-containing protein [Flavobacteriales bacterium]
MIRTSTLFSALVLPVLASAQIVIDNTISPVDLVQNILLGQGVTVSNIRFNGAVANTATEQMGSFSGTCNVGIATGVVMGTGDVHAAEGPNDESGISQGTGSGYVDDDLALISPDAVNDVAVLEFDFVPTGDSLKFSFVFGSDEYPDFVCSQYNDV